MHPFNPNIQRLGKKYFKFKVSQVSRVSVRWPGLHNSLRSTCPCLLSAGIKGGRLHCPARSSGFNVAISHLVAMGTQTRTIWECGTQGAFSSYLSYYVLPIDESLEATHSCLIIQREDILCLDRHVTFICVRLKKEGKFLFT